jgi:hypothetical protein
MSSKTRMMGAGNAGSTKYKSNVNLNTFGGSKKQGITSRVGLDNWANVAVQTYSNGYGRNQLFYMNQLGGIGTGKSMFNGNFSQKDGVHDHIDTLIARLERLLQFYYVNLTDPYQLALVGDKETFKQDLINAQEPELADEVHDKIIHFDQAYEFPPMPYRNEIISIVSYLNNIIRKEIPYMERYGTHTLAMMPTNTGLLLQNVRYGLTKWHGLRIYYGSGLLTYETIFPEPFTFPLRLPYAQVTGFIGSGENLVVANLYNGLPVTDIAANAFDGKALSGTFELPQSVVNIGNRAFSGCTGLTTIDLQYVQVIGVQAFLGCTGLQGPPVISPGALILTGANNIAKEAFRGTKFTTAYVGQDSHYELNSFPEHLTVYRW